MLVEDIGSIVGLLPLSGVEVIFGPNVLLGGLENLLLPANFFLLFFWLVVVVLMGVVEV